MPSKDTHHAENPQANEWMSRESVESSSSTPKTSLAASPVSAKRVMSAQILRLADRLGRDAETLAKKMPADTVRRTKYPVIEIVNPDGTRSYKHDPGIEEGRIAAR